MLQNCYCACGHFWTSGTKGLNIYFLGCDDGRAAKQFIHSLASAVKLKCEETIQDSSFFSLLSDGSQSRKTKEDKELLLARIVRHGLPVYLLINFINMSDFGGTDANYIKDGMDAAFAETNGRVRLIG